MKLLTVNVNTIPLSEPLPFSLRNVDGVLLAGKGFVFSDQESLEVLAEHGVVYIDQKESKQYRDAMLTHIRDFAIGNASVSQLAESPLSTIEVGFDRLTDDSDDSGLDADDDLDWLDLQTRANNLLRDVGSIRFFSRLDRLHKDLKAAAHRNPDATLFALIHLAASEKRYYSATHAMLVCVMTMLAAREVLNWPDDMMLALGRTSLTMNISMTELQDQLAIQPFRPSPEQTRLIDAHPERSVAILRERGVTDPIWLTAILEHHRAASGPLTGRIPAHQIARLIRRADAFSARLSPRATRAPMIPARAMKATYLDESQNVCEAGASLIKAVGIYPPGSFVKLASNEIGTVVQRGANSLTPRVAVLINRSGLPIAEPALRDTRLNEYRIVSTVDPATIKIRSDLIRLVAMI